MRAIKFRAWRGIEMIYQQDEFSESVASFFNRVHGQHYVMQFTGLKDSKGVDIYEGDILEYDLSEEAGFPESEKGIVHFSPSGFWTSQDNNHLQEILSEELESFPTIVIGNIYANPELI